MAQKRVIELEVKENFKQVEKDLDSLNQSLDETASSTRDVNKSFAEVYGELQPLTTRLGEAEDRLYELAAAGDTASQEYKDLLKTVADYRKIQINTDMVVDAASTTMSQKLGGALSGIASGFEVAQGAMAVFGLEGQGVQDALLKVQSAMAISQGIDGLREASKSFKALGESAMTALKGIRSGLAATGIGLFVVALGTVVAYWDDIKAAVSGVTSEQKKLNEISKAKFETSKAELQNLDAQDNILKLQGKSEREILNLKIAKVNTAIELGKIQLKNVIATSKAEEKAALENYKLTKRIVDFILDTALFLPKLMLMPIDMAIKGANKVSEALGFGKLIAFDMGKTMEDMQNKFSGFIAGSLFNVDEVKAQGEKTRTELEKELKDLENQKAGFQLTIKSMDQKAAADSKNDKKDETDAKLAAEKEYNEKLRVYYDAIEQERQGQITDAKEKELQALDNKFEALYKAADDANQSDKELLLKHQQEIADINLKFDLLAQEEAKKNADELAKIEKDKLDEIDKANKEAADKERERKKRNHDFAIEMAQSGLSTIQGLTELFGKKNEKAAKKAFQINKAAQIASATIDTYKSATAAYASQIIPGDPTSPVRAAIAAGVAIAAGLVNVAKIASQKFEGGGSSGGGGTPSGAGGGGEMVAPNFNVIGTSGVNQLAQIQQQPTRAYVVSGDVATGLSLERNRLQNASF